jgi:hypothetical protein
VVDATRVIEVARREKSRGIFKAGSKRESGLAPLSGGWLPEKYSFKQDYFGNSVKEYSLL